MFLSKAKTPFREHTINSKYTSYSSIMTYTTENYEKWANFKAKLWKDSITYNSIYPIELQRVKYFKSKCQGCVGEICREKRKEISKVMCLHQVLLKL